MLCSDSDRRVSTAGTGAVSPGLWVAVVANPEIEGASRPSSRTRGNAPLSLLPCVGEWRTDTVNFESRGRDLFIVDNSVEGWTGLRYLGEWAGIARAFDI